MKQKIYEKSNLAKLAHLTLFLGYKHVGTVEVQFFKIFAIKRFDRDFFEKNDSILIVKILKMSKPLAQLLSGPYTS